MTLRKILDTGIKRLEERAKSLSNENQRNTYDWSKRLGTPCSMSLWEQMQQQMSNMMPGAQMCNKTWWERAK